MKVASPGRSHLLGLPLHAAAHAGPDGEAVGEPGDALGLALPAGLRDDADAEDDERADGDADGHAQVVGAAVLGGK